MSERRVYEYAFVVPETGNASEYLVRGEVVASDEDEARIAIGLKLGREGRSPNGRVAVRPF